MRFQRLLVTSLFVHIPTPRVKVVATLSLDDIKISGESVHISIGVEKNSFRKLGLKEAVGRQVFSASTIGLASETLGAGSASIGQKAREQGSLGA